MSQEPPIRPCTGTAAGVPYLALPSTAVDARPAGPTRLVVAWHGFDPPRTAAALAAALPMTGVPTWRVYLHLPASGARPPAGLGGDGAVEAYGAAVERAVDLFPTVLEEVRGDLGIEPGPVGLAGFSVGASVVLLALATGAVPVTAAALVSPITAPARTVAALEKQTGRPYAWTDRARAVAERLVLTARVDEIAQQDAAMLLISGSRDRLVRTGEMTRLRDLLVERGARTVEAATFRMGHALAAEPGVDARPPIAEAVSVDGALTDWFREHLAVVGSGTGRAETRPAAGTPRHAPLRLEGSRLQAAGGTGGRRG